MPKSLLALLLTIALAATFFIAVSAAGRNRRFVGNGDANQRHIQGDGDGVAA